MIRENQVVPDGDGLFRSFTWACLNNTGRIAMHAVISDSALGVNNGGGIFLVSGGLPRRQVVRRNAPAPGGDSFSSFDAQVLAFNNGGQVAFRGLFNGGSSGLFIGNGNDLLEITRPGRSLAGSTVTAAVLMSNIPLSDDHRSAINDSGQVAFFALTANGQEGVFVYTPVLAFQASASGSFDDPANWTLGLLPTLVHDVIFSPAINLTLTGPTVNRTVKSLQMGGGAGTAMLQLQQGVTLTVPDGLTLAANGVLSGNGLVTGHVSNGGLVSPGTSPGGLQVTGSLTQSSAGRLMLEIGGTAAGSFDKLTVTQTLAAAGTLEVVWTEGFVAQSGASFDLIDAAGTTGSFSAVTLPALTAGLAWDAADLYSNGILRVTGGANSAIEAWRQQYFGTTANSGSAADMEDPDHDGTVNLMEFATLTHPMLPTIPPVSLVLNGANLEFTYQRNKPALAEVSYAVQWSDTLAAGEWSTGGVTEFISDDDGTVQQIRATLPAGPGRRFVRLAVSRSPSAAGGQGMTAGGG